MKKQLIFVIHTLKVGGAERQVVGLANHLVNYDFDIQIVLLDDAVVNYKVDDRIKIVCINKFAKSGQDNAESVCVIFQSKEKRQSIREKLQLHSKRFLDKKKSEIFEFELFLWKQYGYSLKQYISNYPEAIVISNMLIPNIVSMIALNDLPNKLVFFEASSPEYGLEEDAPELLIRKKYIKRANAAVFQTDEQKKYYSNINKLTKKVIPNFLDSKMLPSPFKGTRRKEIVNFCHLVPEKNLRLLIDAFIIFRENHPEYKLGIYGEGGERIFLEKYIRSNNIEDCVTLYGESKNVHESIVDAAMFVSSSNREGLSNSMLEALAIGLPTVCTDCNGGGARMIINNEENGLLVPMNDPKAMSTAMSRIADDNSFAEKISKNAVNIREQLKIETIVDEWVNFLEEISND